MAIYQPRSFPPKPKDSDFDVRRNEQIRASSVLLVDENGENLGEVPTADALRRAKELDLDLVEVASKANPPVAKIISWSKFRYELTKKKKDSHSKSTEMKEMWFKVFIGDGDLEHKLKKVKEFIDKKCPVKLTIRTKGRVTKDLINDLMSRILEKVSEYAEQDSGPKFQGRNLSIIIRPRKVKLKKQEDIPVASPEIKVEEAAVEN